MTRRQLFRLALGAVVGAKALPEALAVAPVSEVMAPALLTLETVRQAKTILGGVPESIYFFSAEGIYFLSRDGTVEAIGRRAG